MPAPEPRATGRRKLFVHIGMHKTGTTSIQKYYARNYDAALRSGMLFPKTASYSYLEHHFPLALTCATPEHRDVLTNGLDPVFIAHLASKTHAEVLAEFVDEIAANAHTDVLLSSEAFCLLTAEEVALLCSHFPDFDIHPIVFIRNFNDFAHSFYYTYIADAAGTLPLESCKVEVNFPLDCVALTERWAKHSADGRVHVCSYDEILRRGETIVGHFANLVRGGDGLPAPIPTQRENVSIAPYSLILIRELRKANVSEEQVRQMIEYLRLLPAAEEQCLISDTYRKRLEGDYWSQIDQLRTSPLVSGGGMLPERSARPESSKPVHIADWSSALLALGRALRLKLSPEVS